MGQEPASPPPVPPLAAATPGPFIAALAGLLIPLAAFAIAWFIAGRIPLAVPTREWGTWFFIGPIMAAGGLVGLVFAFKAFARGSRTAAVAAFILNAMLVLIAWAGLFG